MRRVPSIAVLAILLGCSGCASVSSREDARAEILRLDADWSAAAAEGRDVDRVVSFWSEDAMVLPPGRPPVVGRQAIRDYVAKSFAVPGFHISWKTTDVVVAGSGDVAYSTGTNRVAFTGPDGKPVVIDGKAVAVWRRDRNGVWKCAVDIWNDTPSAPQ
jgi:ketosteroid isomerase-like protein